MITKDRQYCIAETEDGKAKCKFCVWIDPEKSIWQAVCRSILKIVGYHFQMISWTWISKRCNPWRCNNEVIASSCQSKTTEIKISIVFAWSFVRCVRESDYHIRRLHIRAIEEQRLLVEFAFGRRSLNLLQKVVFSRVAAFQCPL